MVVREPGEARYAVIPPYPARWLLTAMATGRTITKESVHEHARHLANQRTPEGRQLAGQMLGMWRQLRAAAMDEEPGAPSVLRGVSRGSIGDPRQGVAHESQGSLGELGGGVEVVGDAQAAAPSKEGGNVSDGRAGESGRGDDGQEGGDEGHGEVSTARRPDLSGRRLRRLPLLRAQPTVRPPEGGGAA